MTDEKLLDTCVALTSADVVAVDPLVMLLRQFRSEIAEGLQHGKEDACQRYQKVALFLLRFVPGRILRHFHAKDQANVWERLFSPGLVPETRLFFVLGTCASGIADVPAVRRKAVANAVAMFWKPFALQDCMCRVFEMVFLSEAVEDGGFQFEQFMQSCLHVSDHLVNVLQDSSPDYIFPRPVFRSLMAQFFATKKLSALSTPGTAPSRKARRFCEHLIRFGRAEAILEGWKTIQSPGHWCIPFFMTFSLRSIESLLRGCSRESLAVFRSFASQVLSKSFLSGPGNAQWLAERVLLSYRVNLQAQRALIRLVFSLATEDRQMRAYLLEVAAVLMQIWSSKEASTQSDIDHQLHLTHVMLWVLSALKELAGERCSVFEEAARGEDLNLLLLSMDGVRFRLDSGVPAVRWMAMDVAEVMHQDISKHHSSVALQFERAEGAVYLLKKMPFEVTLAEQEEEEAVAETAVSSVGEERVAKGKLLYESYSMEEAEEGAQYRASHLWECIENLCNKDDFEVTQAALDSIEGLIRAEPPELSVQWKPLANTLLRLDDRFALQNFAKQRVGALTALCVVLPSHVSAFLLDEFYRRELSLGTRFEILQVLISAALELAGHPQSRVKAADSPLVEVVNRATVDEPSVTFKPSQTSKAGTVTRRSRKGGLHGAAATRNRFTPVASAFFWGLARGYDTRVRTLDLLARDVVLLGKLVEALGIFVECSRYSPGTEKLPLALVKLVWSLRYHRSEEVREAVLGSLIRALLVLPSPMALLGALGAEGLQEVSEWLQVVAASDPSKACRGKAALLLKHALFRQI